MGHNGEATPTGDQSLIGQGGRNRKSKNVDLFPFLYDFALLPGVLIATSPLHLHAHRTLDLVLV